MQPLTHYLRTDQTAILQDSARVKVIAMGRRWGKTVMSGVYALTIAQYGGAVAWVAPTFRNSRPLWRFCEAATNPQAVTVHKAEREITFPGGGRIGIYSADNDVSIRGESFDLVIIDEAAQVKEETYSDVILPTIADRDGRIMLISTPRGRNWFFSEYLKAKERGAAWNAPSNANPMPTIQRAYEMAKERVTARAFRQEWQAEFIDDGSFFTNVEAVATATAQDKAQAGHEYAIGVDWARASGGDYTVFAVIDATTRELVNVVRMQGQAFDVQRNRLAELCKRFNDAPILAEYNSMGMPLVEDLQRAGLPVTAFTTTAATKHEIITGLALALEQGELKLLNDAVVLGELQAYEMKQRAGLPSYSAPDGLHDDTVIALALAWQQCNSGVSILFEV